MLTVAAAATVPIPAFSSMMMILLQESKRVKYVFYLFVGSSAIVIAKVRCERLLAYFESTPHFVSVACQRSQT